MHSFIAAGLGRARSSPDPVDGPALLEAFMESLEYRTMPGYPFFLARLVKDRSLEPGFLTSAPSFELAEITLASLAFLSRWGHLGAGELLFSYVKDGRFWESALSAACKVGVSRLECLEEVAASRLEEETCCPPLFNGAVSKIPVSEDSALLRYNPASSAAKELWSLPKEEALKWARRFAEGTSECAALAQSIILAYAEPSDECFLHGVLTAARGGSGSWYDAADALARLNELSFKVGPGVLLPLWEVNPYPALRYLILEAADAETSEVLLPEALYDADVDVRLLAVERTDSKDALEVLSSDLFELGRVRQAAAARLSVL